MKVVQETETDDIKPRLDNHKFLEGADVEKQKINEQEIWALFKSGREEAIIYFYQKYSQEIFRFSRFYIGEELAKDILQELFLRLIKRRKQLGDVNQVKPYLFKAAYRLIKDTRNQHGRVSKIQADAYHNSGDNYLFTSIERKIIDQETITHHLSRLNEAINKLPEKYKEAILLHYYHGLTHSEIAYIKRKSSDSIRKVLHRSIDKLKSFMT